MEKGLISIYVLCVMLFFIFVTIGIYNVTNEKSKIQLETLEETVKIYNEVTI